MQLRTILVWHERNIVLYVYPWVRIKLLEQQGSLWNFLFCAEYGLCFPCSIVCICVRVCVRSLRRCFVCVHSVATTGTCINLSVKSTRPSLSGCSFFPGFHPIVFKGKELVAQHPETAGWLRCATMGAASLGAERRMGRSVTVYYSLVEGNLWISVVVPVQQKRQPWWWHGTKSRLPLQQKQTSSSLIQLLLVLLCFHYIPSHPSTLVRCTGLASSLPLNPVFVRHILPKTYSTVLCQWCAGYHIKSLVRKVTNIFFRQRSDSWLERRSKFMLSLWFLLFHPQSLWLWEDLLFFYSQHLFPFIKAVSQLLLFACLLLLFLVDGCDWVSGAADAVGFLILGLLLDLCSDDSFPQFMVLQKMLCDLAEDFSPAFCLCLSPLCKTPNQERHWDTNVRYIYHKSVKIDETGSWWIGETTPSLWIHSTVQINQWQLYRNHSSLWLSANPPLNSLHATFKEGKFQTKLIIYNYCHFTKVTTHFRERCYQTADYLSQQKPFYTADDVFGSWADHKNWPKRDCWAELLQTSRRILVPKFEILLLCTELNEVYLAVIY